MNKTERKPSVVIIGSGNVASHIAPALATAGFKILQVYSRSGDHARELAEKVGAEYTNDLSGVTTDACFYLVSVSDNAITDIAREMPKVSGIVAHTSGSIPIDAIAGVSRGYGVFYPLQTFSKNAEVDVAEVPFFIEGSDTETSTALTEIAGKISRKVEYADSRRRAVLHLAAVFACNFTNYMWDCASQVLANVNLDLSVLEPLLRVTLDKALSIPPCRAQTGPAVRNDTRVMEKQAASLPSDLRNIYITLSNSIIKRHEQD